MKKLARPVVILAMLLTTVLVTPRAGNAGGLDPAHVPADAKWVVHIDLESFCNSKLAEAYRNKRPEKVARFRNKMRERYGIDPQDDFKGLTMFSDSYKQHSGAAILVAEYDREKVKEGVLSQKGVKTSEWRDYTLYTWQLDKDDKGKRRKHRGAHADRYQHEHGEHGGEHGDHGGDTDEDSRDKKAKGKKRTVTAVLVDDTTVVFAGTKKRAKEVVKLVTGDAESLQGDDSRLVADVPEGAFLYGAAIDLQEISAHKRPFPILKQHEFARLVVGERDGEMFEHVRLEAKDEETANQMKEALEGLVALSKVMTADVESLRALHDEAEISQDGATVNAKWSGATDDVIEAVEDACEHIKQRREAKRQRGKKAEPEPQDV